MPEPPPEGWIDALAALAQRMLDDGDSNVAFYGRDLADLLRLMGPDVQKSPRLLWSDGCAPDQNPPSRPVNGRPTPEPPDGEWEHCRRHGHDFSQVVEWGCLAPRSVVCRCCGSEWLINPDDALKDFPVHRAT